MARTFLYQDSVFPPQPIGGAPANTKVHGWQPLNPEIIDKPFPVAAQQFAAQVAEHVLATVDRQGFYPQPPDRFVKPLAPTEQQFNAYQPESTPPSPPTPHGWYVELGYKFTAPFSPAQQIFSVWDLVGQVPIFYPPGSGKKYPFPSYTPQPPYEARKNPTFRPVWDKPRQGEIEQPAQQAPLPPASLFTPPSVPAQLFSPHAAPQAPLNIPSFGHFAPADSLAIDKHMRDVQDQADVMAMLRSMGIVRDQ